MSASLKAAVVGLLCLAAGWFAGGIGGDQTKLTFLSVGQGDCAVIQVGHRAILVDAGPSEGAAKIRILPKLRQLGVMSLAAVLLTHPDKDHVAGVPVLARQMPSLIFAIPEGYRENAEWQGLLSEWKLDPSRVVYLPERATATFASLNLQLFCPPVSASADNDGSLFLRVNAEHGSAVLSGDATAESEALAAASGDWAAQVMKAGHHGSKTSTSFGWLAEVKPSFAVVSCGRGNRYGHPHRETLDRISRAGVRLLRTDEDGDVSFVLRDGKFELQPR